MGVICPNQLRPLPMLNQRHRRHFLSESSSGDVKVAPLSATCLHPRKAFCGGPEAIVVDMFDAGLRL